MKTNLSLLKSRFLLLCFFVISPFLLSQNIVNYPLANDLLKDGPDGTLGSTLTYSNPPPQHTLNYLQYKQSGDQVVFSFNATNYSGLQLKFTGGIITAWQTGYYQVYVKVGAGPEVLTTYSITSLLFLNSVTYTLDLAAADNQANVVIRIVGTFGGATALGIQNLGLTANITTMSVKRNVGASTVIPYDAPSSTLLDTDFGNLFTNQESVQKEYVITNTGSKNLKIESITLDPSDQDFTIDGSIPNTITPGNTGTFTVKFAPQNQGLKVANVVIKANVKPNNPFQFQVKGGGKSCNLSPVTIARRGFELTGDNLGINYNSTTPGVTGGSSNNPNPPVLGTSILYPDGTTNYKLYVTDSPDKSIFVRGRNANGATNGTDLVKLDFGPIDLTEQQEVSILFDVAAFGTEESNAGVNGYDYVILSVLRKGGYLNVPGDWIEKIELRGSNSNYNNDYNTRSYRYGFGGALIERNYNDVKLIRENTNSIKYGQFKLNIPISELTNNFTFRITARTGQSKQGSKYYNRNLWLIDNVRIEAGNAKIKTWNGTGWVGGNNSRPDSFGREKVLFASDYNFTGSGETGDLSVCECDINNGVNLTVPTGKILTVRNKISNNQVDGTVENFIIESDASLVQNQDAALNAGNVLVKRNLTFRSDDRKEYNYLISPVENGNLKTDMYRTIGGTPVTAPFVLYHTESNNKFYNSSGAYIAGRSLAVKEPEFSSGAVSTAFFKGKPFNGIINYNLAYSGALLGYNLVGNPYPSNLDLLLLYGDNSAAVESSFRFWDNSVNGAYAQQGTGYTGDAYAIFNAASGPNGTGTPAPGTILPGDEGIKVPNKIVKVGQGFMVKSKGINKVLHYSNHIRLGDNTGSVFYGKQSPDNRYWLKMTAPSGIVSTIAMVYFDGGNNLFSEDDSRATMTSDVVYSVVEDEKLAINGRSNFANTDIVPLGTKHFVAGNYTIDLGDKEGIFANGQNIYLKDKQTGIITNLSLGTYTFAATAGESSGRFEIIYQPETILATNANGKDQLIVYRDGTDFVVKSQGKKITSVELYDASGRLLLEIQPNDTKAVIQSAFLAQGVYVLKIAQNAQMTMKKIIK